MIKKILFIILLISIFIGAVAAETAVVQAAAKDLEIEYPNIPLAQTPNTIKTLIPEYIRYVMIFGMVFSGLIIFGSLLFAGFLYMTSSGNPAALKNSKDRMFSAFLGIIILLSSYLILNTINPSLIELKISPRASVRGVVFVNAGGERYETLTSVSDFDATPVSAPVTVELSSANVEVIPCRDINNFDRANCEGLYPTIVNPPASSSFPSDAKAAKLVWKIPGVYLYDETNYGGELKIYTTSQGALTHFNDRAGSINFLNPKPLFTGDNRRFGTVLHESEGFEGNCEFIWQAQANLADLAMGITLDNWNNEAGSITVFKLKSTMPYDGGGVKFYKEPNYQSSTPDELTFYKKEINWVTFAGKGMPNNGIYSIKIDGDYLVAIAENNDGSGKCEIFFKSDSDLSDNPIGQCTLIGQCSPDCWGWPPYFCPVCTGSCASSFMVIPLAW
ncbi:hypothetical protein KKF47_01165 [Patescibacteria group bacterium]|nr:hypothetical protein [Patescibacteria group bacterium]